MIKLSRLFPLLLVSSIVATVPAGAAEPTATMEADPLRATLLESKEKNRGVTLYINGASINMVVTGIDAHYVIGRSQQANRIVVRIDRVDSASAIF